MRAASRPPPPAAPPRARPRRPAPSRPPGGVLASRARVRLHGSSVVVLNASSSSTPSFSSDPLGMSDPIEARAPSNPSPTLINADLAPVLARDRTFDVADVASLWIGLVVCVPAYTLAGSVVDLGMSVAQGIACISLANLIVLIPMLANGHAGTKYGAPFPVLARAAFGVKGAHLPALARALVGCGWFGIQTHVGGQALRAAAVALAPRTVGAFAAAHAAHIPNLAIAPLDLACYLAFLVAQMAIIARGVESLRELERFAAPTLVALVLALFAWAFHAAGGSLGPMLSAPSAFVPGGALEGKFWSTFAPMLTATVGFWATLSLNVSDFTRFATSQRAQARGQMFGLPAFMAAFSFVSVVITSCSAVIFGAAVRDPIALLAKMGGGAATTTAAAAGILAATLSTNVAANVVAPANALVNLAPDRVTFETGGYVTAVLGTLIMPWRLVADVGGYIFVWLSGYGALLGPAAGIMIADYHVLRRRKLDVDALYADGPGGGYWYEGGVNPAAVWAFVAGVAPCVPGFLRAAGAAAWAPKIFVAVFDVAWFVGFFVGAGWYLAHTAWLDERRRKKKLS